MITEPEAIYLHKKYISIDRKTKEFAAHQNLCVKKFAYIIFSHAEKYKKFPNYRDLIQDGFLSMMLAFNSYDETKGNIFYWMHQYVSTYIARSASKHSVICVPMAKARNMNPNKLLLSHFFKSEGSVSIEKMFEKEIFNNLLTSAIETLDDKKKFVVRSKFRFDNNTNLSKILYDAKISQHTFKKELESAMCILRKYFELYVGDLEYDGDLV